MKLLVKLLVPSLALIAGFAWVGYSREASAADAVPQKKDTPPQDPPAVTTPTPGGDGQTNPTVTGSVTFNPNGVDTAIDWTHDASAGSTSGNLYDIRVYQASAFDDKKALPSMLSELAAFPNNAGATDFNGEVDIPGKVLANAKFYYLVIDTLEYKTISTGSGKDELKGRHMFVRVYTKGDTGWTTSDATDMAKSVIEIK